MKVMVCASISNATPWWEVAKPNWLEYCERHEYQMVEAEESLAASTEYAIVHELLDKCELLWTLNADCVITNMTTKIDALDCLGPHATICREGYPNGPLLNGGSIVWRNTRGSRQLAERIRDSREEWAGRQFVSQDWLCDHHEELSDVLTVVPERTFNSVWPIWQPGDFVYHACGLSAQERSDLMRQRLGDVIR